MSKKPVFQITILSGGEPGKKNVQADECVVGRREGCDLIIDHKDVSRKHIVLKAMYGQVLIEDLGSSNGTFLNGNQVQPNTPTVVSPADIVSLGRHVNLTIVCEGGSATASAPPTPSPSNHAPAPPPPNHSAAPPPPSTETKAKWAVESQPKFAVDATPPTAKAIKKEVGLEIEKPTTLPQTPLPRAIRENRERYAEVIEARAEAQRMIANAQKQSASIVQEAERLAEVKTQGFYERARKAEAEAHELYKTRTEEAHRDGVKLFDEARAESTRLVNEAREKAQHVRDQAEKFAADLQEETHRKMGELLRAGELQAREVVIKKEKEAAEYLRRREKELEAEVFARVKDECDQRRQEAADELERMEKQAADRLVMAEVRHRDILQSCLDGKLKSESLNKDVVRLSDEQEKLRKELAGANAELDMLRSQTLRFVSEVETSRREQAVLREDIKKLEAEQDRFVVENQKKRAEMLLDNEKAIAESGLRLATLKKEVEKYAIEKARLVNEVDDAKSQGEACLRALRDRLDTEKAKLAKDEQTRLDEMKLETDRQLRKFEQEMLLDIQSNKLLIAREIMLVMETALSGKIHASQIVDLQDVMQDQIVQVLQSPTSVSSGGGEKTEMNLGKARRRNQLRHTFSGAAMGAALVFVVVFGSRYVQENLNPVDRSVASAVAEKKADLERRKFNPPQKDEVYDNYTDSVIYSRGFVDLYLDSEFQVAYGKALSYHMLRTFQLSEDKTTQAIARLAALVKTLNERKEKIHPDFVKKGLEQMRELEATTLKEITQDLGSIVRLEALQKFEQAYIKKKLY